MNLGLNKKIVGFVSALAIAGMSYAQEAPVAQAAPAAPAETAAAPSAEPAPAAEAAPAAAPVAAPAETAAPAAEPASADAAAPMAVRGGEVPAEAVTAPAPTETRTVTKVVYQPVYTTEPTAVRSTEYVPVQTVYVAQTPGKDTVTFDELRGLVPIKTLIGVQGAVGSYIISSDNTDDYYNDFEDYYGMTWRVGAFTVLPLTDYTVGLRLGVLYEQSDASATEVFTNTSVKAMFKQRKIDVPALFAFKSPRSSFMFEVGTQVSFPIKDEFKVSYDDQSSKLDMIDKDYRRSVDWDFVIGFAVKANNYVGLDFMINGGLSNMYDCNKVEYDSFNLNSLSSVSFLLGISIYLF